MKGNQLDFTGIQADLVRQWAGFLYIRGIPYRAPWSDSLRRGSISDAAECLYVVVHMSLKRNGNLTPKYLGNQPTRILICSCLVPGRSFPLILSGHQAGGLSPWSLVAGPQIGRERLRLAGP
jgi:hypothetical protein